MKSTKRIMAIVVVLVFMLTLVMTSAVFAGTSGDKDNGKSGATEERAKDKEKADTTKTDATEKAKAAETKDSTTETTAALETKEEKAVKEKDKVMEQKKVLTKQLIEARKTGNAEEIAKLQAQVKAYKEQLKKLVRETYTAEETAQLQVMAQTIEAADPTVEVLPVDTIIAKGKNLKLDIPPVIKEGKVLVPVKAFSQAYGAEVKWNGEAQTITITKEGLEVVLKVGSNTVMVNGVATTLELPVKGINGRNVIPVGFLAAKLGLKTEVDAEDGTIEIEETTAAGTTTPAPTVTPTPTPVPTGTTGTGN